MNAYCEIVTIVNLLCHPAMAQGRNLHGCPLCWHLLAMNGTFLKGLCKMTPSATVTLDEINQALPLAWNIVPNKC